ncbi:MAG: helix-turn-helix transcriptional regulator [Actinomycetota bacterium]
MCLQTRPSRLITVTEAASVARVSEKTIRRRLSSRKLKYLRVGGRAIRIRRGDLEAWLDKGQVAALDDREVV